jgi:hypothetical protein
MTEDENKKHGIAEEGCVYTTDVVVSAEGQAAFRACGGGVSDDDLGAYATTAAGAAAAEGACGEDGIAPSMATTTSA